MSTALRLLRRRWAPWEGVLLRNIEDIEVNLPHIAQFIKRYRYRLHLARVFKPANPTDEARFAVIMKQLRPNPIVITVSAALLWIYVYPLLFGMAVVVGLLRSQQPVPGGVGTVEPKLASALELTHAAVKAGHVVQLHGTSASTVARRYAAVAPGVVWYMRVREVRDTLGSYELYPVQFCCMGFYLTQMQVRAILTTIKFLFDTPVTLVVDANTFHIEEAKMREHMRTVVHKDRLASIVYCNAAPTSTTYLASQPVTAEDRIVVLMTDLPDTSVKSILGAGPKIVTALRSAAPTALDPSGFVQSSIQAMEQAKDAVGSIWPWTTATATAANDTASTTTGQ